MERLNFSTHINAPRERVWKVLWGDATYPQWTRPFSEGGSAVSDWKEGSRVLFLSAEGDGMFGRLYRVEENAFMGIEHLGIYTDGREQPEDDTTREWAGALETYSLTESNGGTDLAVTVDITEKEADAFRKMFPDAFAIVKEFAEE